MSKIYGFSIEVGSSSSIWGFSIEAGYDLRVMVTDDSGEAYEADVELYKDGLLLSTISTDNGAVLVSLQEAGDYQIKTTETDYYLDFSFDGSTVVHVTYVIESEKKGGAGLPSVKQSEPRNDFDSIDEQEEEEVLLLIQMFTEICL